MFEVSATMIAELEAEASRIEAARSAVAQEIRSFPTPFPACDIHFPRLQEERRRLQRMADAIEEMLVAACTDDTPLLHPRDAVFTASGKHYQPEPVAQ